MGLNLTVHKVEVHSLKLKLLILKIPYIQVLDVWFQM